MPDLPLRYSKPFVLLHWLAATAVIANLSVGMIFADMPRGADRLVLFKLHASLGLTVLLLGLTLAGLRIGRKVPPLPIGMPMWMRLAAKGSHDMLYTLIVLIPLSGWLMVSVAAGTRGVPFFGFEFPALPFVSDLTQGAGRDYHEALERLHGVTAFGMLLLVPIHVGAAMYHQFWRRDGVLARMIPWLRIGT